MNTTAQSIDLDSRYELTDENINQFRQDGFIKLKNFYDAKTLEHYSPILTDLTLKHNPNKNIPLESLDTYGKAFIQVGNLWEEDEQAKAFAFSRHAAQVATQLLGVDGVRMWHDQALYKEPSGGFTPWHVDQQYWPLGSSKCLTLWIPLQETPIEMGPLRFAAGSHLKQIGREMAISDESERLIEKAVKQEGLSEVYEPYDLGEVSFHYGWTLHRAGPNTTKNSRKVFTVIYIDKDMTLEPKTPNQRNDWAAWSPGTHVGRVLDDPKNPILFEL
ncbi:MAG: phytanoyl-CoA dioxygenase family protein [Phycisphaeraceae bacterium]|nr:phytanoyl-CoA dioxygenase family protein [Phycisphaeraceae bacterium]